MRIDRFTEIVNIDDRVFLFNIKTGAMDEVNTHIANELLKLQRKGSFTPLECNLKESLIEEMIDRGYITYYSDREETDERKWFLAKHKEKAKKEEKTASLLLDNVVGNNWCYKDSSIENLAMGKIKFVDLLKNIGNNDLTNKIDLWLLLQNRIDDWEWIDREVSINGLKINSLFTIVKNKTELEEIKNWIKITPSAPTVVHIKYEKEEFGYFTFTKVDNKIINKENNIIFLSKHPFFCPFIYKTFFVDGSGNISYCVKKLINKEQIGKIDSTTRKITFEHGWGEKLFTANCDKSDSCIYSIYCSNMCPYLNSIYKNGDECSLVQLFESLLVKKIKCMM